MVQFTEKPAPCAAKALLWGEKNGVKAGPIEVSWGMIDFAKEQMAIQIEEVLSGR